MVLRDLAKWCKMFILWKREKAKRKKRASRDQVQEWRGRKFNHAPRAGKELTAGGSRTQPSMADATGNVPSAISRVGSRAVAIELCRATERRLHHRRWNASCIDRRSTVVSFFLFQMRFLIAFSFFSFSTAHIIVVPLWLLHDALWRVSFPTSSRLYR